MRLLGDRYATVRGHVNGRPHVLKLQDHPVPRRLLVRCFRELLGARLAGATEVTVPPTRLVDHRSLGRSRRSLRWRARSGSRSPSRGRCARTPIGIRLAPVDLAIDNRDRRPANVLIRGYGVQAIDFDAAFVFPSHAPEERVADVILGRWLCLGGIVALRPRDRERWAAAAVDVAAAVGAGIDAALAPLPDRLVEPGQRTRLHPWIGSPARRCSPMSETHEPTEPPEPVLGRRHGT
jgi:hypothetical protein